MPRASTMTVTPTSSTSSRNGGSGAAAPPNDRPSSARRQYLRQMDEESGAIPTVSTFFPLEKYFDASDKLLASFENAFERRSLDDAFVYGIRYGEFCVKQLVKHDYYHQKKFDKRKATTNLKVMKVVEKLELIADWMDVEESEKARIREAKRKEEEARKFADFQKRIEAQKESVVTNDAIMSVEESAFAKLQRLAMNNNNNVPMDPPTGDPNSLPPPMLPPPIPPPTNGNDVEGPPSYEALEGNRLSYFGPGGDKGGDDADAPLPSYDQLVQSGKARPSPSRPKSVRKLKEQAVENYVKYQHKGSIQVSGLKTYQGRYGHSTNGCTVISALCAARHLEQHGGITDESINQIIDNDCGPFLRKIRSSLGLNGSSLIIPSDVHDYLVDAKVLHQHKFVGAAGGNILEPEHIGPFMDMLKGDEKTRHLKAAATLFFHEHVISIVKFPTSSTEAVYDLIDSMPNMRTSSGAGVGTRTRCHGLTMLQELLVWYATHKFSSSNLKYIEQHPEWDDKMADFDPRVFQGFVWADIPEMKQ